MFISALRNISKVVLGNFTGTPAESAFFRDHVVPAKKDDKFNDNKCVRCWGEYDEEHPGVKILPCGHVFGRDCLHDMMEGPSGDLCPICRVKLFRPDFTFKLAVTTVVTGLCGIQVAYMKKVNRLAMTLHQAIQNQPSWQELPYLLILIGPPWWAGSLVDRCTEISSRNPRLVMGDAFGGTSPAQLLYTATIFAPLLVPTYFIAGMIGVKVLSTYLDLQVTLAIQTTGWKFFLASAFDCPSDRTTVACTVAGFVLFKELIIVWIVWWSLT